MRVFFTNLGCKLNQAEIEQLARRFRGAGHQLVGALAEADLHVVNTCSVTHRAARDSRKIARRGRRVNPRIRTVLTGCHVSADPAEAAGLAGVDLVVPNRDKDLLLERVHGSFAEIAHRSKSSPVMPAPCMPLEFGKSRALVKVEDGCNMRCSFCIIPSARGRQRSRPMPEVVAEVLALGAAGHAEVVITGVQISSYRWRDSGLFELVQELLEQTPIPRFRLTSIAPWQFDQRLLELFATARLCRHVHLSLQSGSTATLRRMRRPYTADGFRRLLESIRSALPDVAVTTDVIVGFPGESEEDFEDSLSFVREMRFARVHVFPFSSRPGTEAAALQNQVPSSPKRVRMERMLEVAHQSRLRFELRHVGASAQVLWETRKGGFWTGLSDNYLRVVTDCEDDLANRITAVRLGAVSRFGMTCTLREAPARAFSSDPPTRSGEAAAGY